MTSSQPPARVWPVGTMVVLTAPYVPTDGGHPRPAGACGIVLTSPATPEGDYRVRFPDGGQFWVQGRDVASLKHYQAGELGDSAFTARAYDLYAHVIYRVVVGSRAYGLDHEASDIDLRGIYLPPASLHWSIYGVPEQLEREGEDACYWELQKFLSLALKANPNVLECLYSPQVELATPLALKLLEQREVFLSKMIYQTYNRYVMSQFKSLTKQHERGEAVRLKHAMHLIRLMLSGITILEEGFVPVEVDAATRDALLAVKAGELSWAQVDAWRLELHARFDHSFEASHLPERPDYARVNDFLVMARHEAARQELG